MANNLRLTSLSFSEEIDKIPELNYPNIKFGNFDLWISDNAQGKTRAIRSFAFICDLVSGKRRIIKSHFKAKFSFEIQSTRKIEKITYEIEILPKAGENFFIEKIMRDKNTILSPKLLFDELKNEPIETFFLPPNILAVTTLTNKNFKTISLVRGFFKTAVFINAGKVNIMHPDPNARKVNPEGTNLADFMINLKQDDPNFFNEINLNFKECFTGIKSLTVKKMHLVMGGPKINILFFKEKGVAKPIGQNDWADGMYRLLWLLSSTKTRFDHENKILIPSIIFIDEIENGLDYKTLKFITNYLRNYSRDIQIVMTTHSPLISDFIELENWKIFKRKGPLVKVFQPTNVEKNLEAMRKDVKYKNYELYIRHISKSPLYLVK